jgi:predicted permease
MKDVVIGDVRATLWLFFAAVGLVLLLACVNVSNLMLARGVARARELGIRSSLGARRGRLLRQLLAESSLLGVISGLAGLALASVLLPVMVSSAGSLLPRVHEVRIDTIVAVVAFSVALLAALGAGLAPAFWLTGRGLGETLRDGGRGASQSPGQGRTRRWLVAAEVAMTLTVLVATTFLIKTMIRLEREDPGFDAAGVLSFRLALPPDPYRDLARLNGFLQTVESRLRRLPGVSAVAFAESLPPDQLQQSNNYTLSGDEPGSANRTAQGSGVAQWNVVTPEYFDVLGIGLQRGRLLTAADHFDAPRVAVVSEAFAHKHFRDNGAIGQRFKAGDWDADAPWITIVGVVADVPYERGVWGGVAPTIYVPYAQDPGSRWQFVVVKAAAGPFAASVSKVVRDVDSSIPLRDVMTMVERLRKSEAAPRFRMMLFTLLAAVALMLAVTGIYGVLSYHVSQRRRETAIRRALGARSGLILGDVVSSGLRLAGRGTVVGLVGAWAAARSLSTFLYGVEINDVAAFLWATTILVIAALLASAIPAVRAIRADPLTVLREE